MKSQFNYPIKILKKRMTKEDYTPFVIDCETGNALKVSDGKSEVFAFFLMQVVFVLLTLWMVFFVVAQPLMQTTNAREIVQESIHSLGGEDVEVVKQLENKGEVISENLDSNVISLVIKVDMGELQKALKLAFSISTIKEVYTDGNTIAISFLSSDK